MMNEFLPTMNVAGILAFLAPLAVTVLTKLTFTPAIKQLIAVAMSVVLAVFALLVTDGFAQIPSNENPVIYVGILILVVVAISQITFRLIWKPAGVIEKIAIATATKSELEEAEVAKTRDGLIYPKRETPEHRAE